MGFVDNWLGGDATPDTSGTDRAARESMALQERMYEESVARDKPFYDIGVQGAKTLQDYMGLGADTGTERYGSLLAPYSPEQLTDDPSYQFRQAEGQKGLERQLAAGGNTFSPRAAKELMRYNQGLASTEYGSAFDRNRATQGDIYNRLAGVSGAGQTASQGLTSAGQSYAGNIGQTLASQADVRTAADQAQQARRDSMFSSIAQGAMMFSDINLKENIEYVREEHGHKIYRFNYKDRDGLYEGVMAQEIQESMPEAVKEINGYLAVDYGMLGLEMREL